MTENKISIKFTKGGVGSGFHGHAGRPGKVGGSSPGGGGGSSVLPEDVFSNPPEGWNEITGHPDLGQQIGRTHTDKRGKFEFSMWSQRSLATKTYGYGVRVELRTPPDKFTARESIFALPSTAFEAVDEVIGGRNIKKFGKG